MATTGKKLKKNLGLDKLKHVKIARAIVSSYKILCVFYDSRRPTMPVTDYFVKKSPWTTMVFHGTDIFHGKDRHVPYSPLLQIEDYNGSLRGAIIITVDLCGKRFVDDRVFTKVFRESRSGLEEYVTLSDLMKSKGTSSFTKFFRKERDKYVGKGVRGSEANVAKVLDIELKDDGLLFHFLTESTPKYPPDYTYKETDPPSFGLNGNPSKTYEMDILILDFMEWLDTYPTKESITSKDMKDIFDVSYVKIWCNCPAQHWQGLNWHLSQLDGSIHPTSIKPKHWNKAKYHGSDGYLCKHLTGLLNGIKFWYQPMASMATKFLKGKGFLS